MYLGFSLIIIFCFYYIGFYVIRWWTYFNLILFVLWFFFSSFSTNCKSALRDCICWEITVLSQSENFCVKGQPHIIIENFAVFLFHLFFLLYDFFSFSDYPVRPPFLYFPPSPLLLSHASHTLPLIPYWARENHLRYLNQAVNYI